MHNVPVAFLTSNQRVLFGVSSQPQYAIGLRCVDDTSTSMFVVIVDEHVAANATGTIVPDLGIVPVDILESYCAVYRALIAMSQNPDICKDIARIDWSSVTRRVDSAYVYTV